MSCTHQVPWALCMQLLSLMQCRGKFTLSFAQNALLIEGPRNRLQVQWEAIKSVAVSQNAAV